MTCGTTSESISMVSEPGQEIPERHQVPSPHKADIQYNGDTATTYAGFFISSHPIVSHRHVVQRIYARCIITMEWISFSCLLSVTNQVLTVG